MMSDLLKKFIEENESLLNPTHSEDLAMNSVKEPKSRLTELMAQAESGNPLPPTPPPRFKTEDEQIIDNARKEARAEAEQQGVIPKAGSENKKSLTNIGPWEFIRDTVFPEVMKKKSLFGKSMITSLGEYTKSQAKGATALTPEKMTFEKFKNQSFQDKVHHISKLLNPGFGPAEMVMQIAGDDKVDKFLTKGAELIDNQIPKEWKKEVSEASQKGMTSLGYWVSSFASQVSLALETYISELGGIFLGGTAGKVAAPLGLLSLTEMGSFLDESEKLGIDKDIREKYAKLYGIGSGGIEYAQEFGRLGAFKLPESIKKPIEKLSSRFLRGVLGISSDGLEEMSQQGLQNFLTNKAIEEHNERNGTDLKPVKLSEGTLESFAQGVVTRGEFNTVGSIYKGVNQTLKESKEATPPQQETKPELKVLPEQTQEQEAIIQAGREEKKEDNVLNFQEPGKPPQVVEEDPPEVAKYFTRPRQQVPQVAEDVQSQRKQQREVKGLIESKPEEKKTFGKRLFKNVMTQMVDDFFPVREMQAEAGNVSEKEDVALMRELFEGKIEYQVEEANKKHYDPMFEEMKKKGISREALEAYLYARHAFERNESIAKRNPQMQDGGSGMSDEEARTLINGFHNAGMLKDLESLASYVDNVTAETRKILKENGLASDEEIKAWEDQWKYYVPLKGNKNTTKNLQFLRTGKGFDVRGQESKRALGRLSKAEDILAQVMAEYHSAVVRKEKNEIGKAFLEFVKKNQNTGLYEIITEENKPQQRYYDEKTGQVKFRTDSLYANQKDIFSVKENGKDVYIKIKDPDILNSLKRVQDGYKPNVVVKGLSKFNRYLAAVNTMKNPEFIISNFIRDSLTAGLTMTAEQKAKYAKDTLAKVPKAIKGILNAELGKDSGEWGKIYDRFKKAGGKVAFVDMVDIESRTNRIDKLLKNPSPNRVKRAVQSFGDSVEALNTAIENGTRLAVFHSALEAGHSEARAASMAKNITVNFNQKGLSGNLINSLYLFANAGIQGNYRVAKTILTSKRGKQLAIGLAGFGLLLSEMNRLVGGEDEDDGKNYWDKIPDYIKDTNLILMLPESKGRYIRIPLPYGFNAFNSVGNRFSNILHGKDPVKEGLGAFGTFANAFNPLGGEGSLLQLVSPTAFDWLVQISENKNFFGSPIYPTKGYDRSKPDSELHFKSARPESVKLAKTLNKVTGGNRYRKGAIDISPETLDHVFDTMTGGLGRFVVDLAGTMDSFVKSEQRPARKIPFLRKVYGEQDGSFDNRSYWETVEKIDVLQKELKDPEERKNIPLKKRIKIRQAIREMKSFKNRIEINERNKKEDRALKLKKRFVKKITDLLGGEE